MSSQAKSRRKQKAAPIAEKNELFDRSTLRERRRQAIIRAAATAFNRQGFHNTSMDDLAAALNTSKPTLYQFFKNKQKLLYACHQHAMDHGEAGLAMAHRDGRSGREKLAIYCRRYMHGVMHDFGSCAVLTDLDALQPDDRAAAIDRRAKISAATREIIEEGLRDGTFASVDSKLASLFVLSVANWILIWYRPDGDKTRDEIVEAFIGMIERGLTPR
ncbi:MAG: TetR/AcrR family transcriptional regulator [Bradyrhizobium sp.]|jgi:AcrR family transcriptional regulator|nr:TetR/AcrR family transcriptional regulator [Bradyrhizobium sp.]